MTTFTTEDRQSVYKDEPIPFAGWISYMDDVVSLLREQTTVQQNEIDRLNERIRYLESQLYTKGE